MAVQKYIKHMSVVEAHGQGFCQLTREKVSCTWERGLEGLSAHPVSPTHRKSWTGPEREERPAVEHRNRLEVKGNVWAQWGTVKQSHYYPETRKAQRSQALSLPTLAPVHTPR